MARIEDETVAADSAEVTTDAENTETTGDIAQDEQNQLDAEPAEPTAEEVAAKAKADEEAAEAAEAEAKAKFQTAVTESLSHEGRDVTTGVLPDAAVGVVTLAYSELSGAKLKRFAKEFLTAQMEANMAKNDMEGFRNARAHLQLFNAVKDGVGRRETVTRQPVDPTEALVDLVTALMLSPNFVTVPEGVAEDWKAQAQAQVAKLWALDSTQEYRKWLDAKAKDPELTTEAPEIDEKVAHAAKLASGRSGGRAAARATGTPTPRAPRVAGEPGERKNIATHIAQAFEGVEPGKFLTIADIANFKSEEYGDRKPSAGAVSARLFPGGDPDKCTLEGVRPESQNDSTGKPRKGAVKVA